jgi:hypothetical protein
MAIKTITFAMPTPSGETGTRLSPPISKTHRPVAVVLSTDGPNVNSWATLFLTKSDRDVTEPQPGDPEAFFLREIPLNATAIAIPLFSQTTIVEQNTRLMLLHYNNLPGTVWLRATYIYEEV